MNKNGGSNMTNLLGTLRSTALGFCLLIGPVQTFGATDKSADGKIQQEMTKFCEDNAKLREDHIQSMRELHLKHVNDLYDRKLVNNKEISELWKSLKPGDKAGQTAIREQIKAKQEAYNKEEENFRKDFKENVLKKKNKEFRDSMDERFKNLKSKHKE